MSSQDDEDQPPLSIAEPYGPRSSTCGYCGLAPGERSATRSSYTFGLETLQLSAGVYQSMIDGGWRRSGTYCYKPDLARSCCPQYTIRLEAPLFVPSRSQRKVVYRFHRFLVGDQEKVTAEVPPGSWPNPKDSTGPSTPDTAAPDSTTGKKKQPVKVSKPSKAEKFSLVEELHALSSNLDSWAHRYEVTLEPSKFTREKFQLYCAYQRTIHHDDDKSQDGFKRFLCESPIAKQRVPYADDQPLASHLPKDYGSYHQMYRLDGKLVAMGVIDILPKCVSSVYLMYNPDFDVHSLGKLSALHEISLVSEMAKAGATGMEYLYMGFYIHSCPKMRYKAQYSLSFLLEPEDQTWHSINKCMPMLDKHRYVPFSHPAKAQGPIVAPSATMESDDRPESIGFDKDDMPDEELAETEPPAIPDEVISKDVQIGKIIKGVVHVRNALDAPHWKNSYSRNLITRTAVLLGEQTAKEVILVFE